MSLIPRKAASLLGAGALGVAAMTGAGWAAGSAAQASVPQAQMRPELRPGGDQNDERYAGAPHHGRVTPSHAFEACALGH
jgi:hypothetical protein